jgi:AraC family transcriptional regulator
MAASSDVLLPVLVHIQANLGSDLSLSVLAGKAGLSRSHFHRVFTERVGETPRAYAERLRLERAALSLWLHRVTVEQTAADLGFRRHETFTRAFRRRFGEPPSAVRRGGLAALASLEPGRDPQRRVKQGTYSLSPTRIVVLEPIDLAFIRHVGPYEEVPDTLFQEVANWAEARGLGRHRPLLGIGHDAPGITPPNKLRFDAAVVVPGPFEPQARIGYQKLVGGRCAITTHVGHYRTLPAAYGDIFRRIGELPGVALLGPPAIEMYHETRIDAELEFNHTDIYLPVTRGPVPRDNPRSETQ